MCFGTQKPQNEPQNLKFVVHVYRKARETRSGTRKTAADGRSWSLAVASLRTTRAQEPVAGGRAPRPSATRHEKGPVAKTGPRGLNMEQARYWMRVRQ